jgi:hypothetical protein
MQRFLQHFSIQAHQVGYQADQTDLEANDGQNGRQDQGWYFS